MPIELEAATVGEEPQAEAMETATEVVAEEQESPAAPESIDDFSYEQLSELAGDADWNGFLETGEAPKAAEPEPENAQEELESEEHKKPDPIKPIAEEEEEPAAEGDRVNRVSLKGVSPEASIEIAKLTREYQDSGATQSFGDWLVSNRTQKPSGESPAGEVTAEEAPKGESAPVANAEISAIDAELKALRVELADNRYDDDLFIVTQEKIDDAVARKAILVIESKQAAERQKAEAKAKEVQNEIYAQQESEALESVQTDYPELKEPKSQFRQRFDEREALLEKTDPKFFHDPKWSQIIANQIATELGKTPPKGENEPGQKGQPKVPTPKPLPQSRAKGQVAGGAERSEALTDESLTQTIGSMTYAQMQEVAKNMK